MSDHSPGLVENDEPLVRTLYSPHQINRVTGEIKPAAFTDVLMRGLSLNRVQHISKSDLQAKIEAKVARDQDAGSNKDGFWAVAIAHCSDLRACTLDDGNRAFCVYDTAMPEDISHADVCQALELKPGTEGRKSFNKKLRSQLLEIFVGPTNLRTVYEADH